MTRETRSMCFILVFYAKGEEQLFRDRICIAESCALFSQNEETKLTERKRKKNNVKYNTRSFLRIAKWSYRGKTVSVCVARSSFTQVSLVRLRIKGSERSSSRLSRANPDDRKDIGDAPTIAKPLIECTRFARSIQQYHFIRSRTLYSRPEQSFCSFTIRREHAIRQPWRRLPSPTPNPPPVSTSA